MAGTSALAAGMLRDLLRSRHRDKLEVRTPRSRAKVHPDRRYATTPARGYRRFAAPGKGFISTDGAENPPLNAPKARLVGANAA